MSQPDDQLRNCPRCGVLRMTKYPALSRVDNVSQICSECGTAEAMLDFMRKPQVPKRYWWINTHV